MWRRGIHGTGERVDGGRVNELEGLLVVRILVDIDGQDGTEDLVDHRHRLGILREDDSRLHEEAF